MSFHCCWYQKVVRGASILNFAVGLNMRLFLVDKISTDHTRF